MRPRVLPLLVFLAGWVALGGAPRLVAQELDELPLNQAGGRATLFPAVASSMSFGSLKPGGASQWGARFPSPGGPRVATPGSVPPPGHPPGLDLILRIYNYAGVPRHVLKIAEEEAQNVYLQGGIHTEWIDCPTSEEEFDRYPSCHRPLTREDLLMFIIPRAPPAKSTSRSRVYGSAEIAGEEECSRYAHAFFDRITESSVITGVSPGLILGSVLAHEAGHLLLGANSHSSAGIMRAHWDDQSLQNLERRFVGFTNADEHRLRMKLIQRIELDHAGGKDSGPLACTTNLPRAAR